MPSRNKIAKNNKYRTDNSRVTKPKKPISKQRQEELQSELQKISNLILAAGILILLSMPAAYFFLLNQGMDSSRFIESLIDFCFFIAMPLGVIVFMLASTRMKRLRNLIGEIPHDGLWWRYTIGKVLCLAPAIFAMVALVSSVFMFVILFMAI